MFFGSVSEKLSVSCLEDRQESVVADQAAKTFGEHTINDQPTSIK